MTNSMAAGMIRIVQANPNSSNQPKTKIKSASGASCDKDRIR